MKIAVYTRITGMGKRFECYTTLEEIEGTGTRIKPEK